MKELITLPPQIHVGHSKPEPDKIEPVHDRRFWKPSGGLWTSSLDEDGGEWLRWLVGESYDLESERWGGKLWCLKPSPAKVAVVHGPPCLRALTERFPHPDATYFADLFREKSTNYLSSFLDWSKLSEEYDALWVPNPWPWRFMSSPEHHDASMFFYSMDAESTVWFRWCFSEEPVEIDPEPYLKRLRESV